MESRTDGNLGCHTEAAIDAPPLSTIHIIYTLHGDAKEVDGLLLADGVSVGSHLKVRGQAAVTETCLQSEAMVQSVLQSQRPCDRHLMVARTQNLVLAWAIGIVQGMRMMTLRVWALTTSGLLAR